MHTLRKEAERYAKQIRELEGENARQRQRLKVKEEEVQRLAQGAHNHRTRRPLTAASHSGSSATRGSPSRHGRPATAPGGGGTGASPARGAVGKPGVQQATSLRRRLKEQQAILDAEVEKQLRRQAATEQLEQELHQREVAVAEKEAALAERHALELRRMRNSEMNGENMVAVNQQLENLAAKLSCQLPLGIGIASASGGDEVDIRVAARKAEAEISVLRREQEGKIVGHNMSDWCMAVTDAHIVSLASLCHYRRGRFVEAKCACLFVLTCRSLQCASAAGTAGGRPTISLERGRDAALRFGGSH